MGPGGATRACVFLLSQPGLDIHFEHIERNTAMAEYDVVELSKVELRAELFLGERSQFANLQNVPGNCVDSTTMRGVRSSR